MNRKKDIIIKSIAGLFSVMVVAFVIYAFIQIDKSQARLENSTKSETQEETVADLSVDYEDIYTAYKENELRADDTYKNNRYQISAKVNGMSTDGLFNQTGGATLTMETSVGSTIVFFTAEFEKEQEEALKTINVGDTITFQGECLSVGTWVDCELITGEN